MRSVINFIVRIYGKILKNETEKEFKDVEGGIGFRKGRLCIDGIFSLNLVIKK